MVYSELLGSSITGEYGDFQFPNVRAVDALQATFVPQRTGMEFVPSVFSMQDLSDAEAPVCEASSVDLYDSGCTRSDVAALKFNADDFVRKLYNLSLKINALTLKSANRVKSKLLRTRSIAKVNRANNNGLVLFRSITQRSAELPELMLSCNSSTCFARSLTLSRTAYVKLVKKLRRSVSVIATLLEDIAPTRASTARRLNTKAGGLSKKGIAAINKVPGQTFDCIGN
jgi:hypothetical protein